MKKLQFTLLFLFGFSMSADAAWYDFMKTAASKVGSAAKTAGGAIKTVGGAAMGGAKCNMMRNQGMVNTPQYYQECVQTGLASPTMGGSPVGLPYGVMPPTGGPGSVQNSTLNESWSDDPLAGVGGQFTQQQGMMGGQPGMYGGGMMGQSGYGMQSQPTSFSGMIGQSLANNLMGGNRGMASGGAYGAQPGYGARPY